MKTANNIRNAFVIIIVILCSALTACVYPYLPHEKQTVLQKRVGDVFPDGYYHYSLGVLFSLDGKIDKAIGEYESALRFDSESSYLMDELATLYIKKGEVDAAVRLLEKSVTRNPEYVDSHILLGGLYGNLKKIRRRHK